MIYMAFMICALTVCMGHLWCIPRRFKCTKYTYRWFHTHAIVAVSALAAWLVITGLLFILSSKFPNADAIKELAHTTGVCCILMVGYAKLWFFACILRSLTRDRAIYTGDIVRYKLDGSRHFVSGVSYDSLGGMAKCLALVKNRYSPNYEYNIPIALLERV